MTAIVTTQFRHNAATQFVADLVDAANTYYIFIGRPSEWANESVPDTPYDNWFSYHTDMWDRMLAMKEITSSDWSYATPRYTWITGTTYAEYDDRSTTLGQQNYYVITESNNVYLCLKSGGTSTVNPDSIGAGGGIKTAGIIDYTGSDGYIWKYMYTLSTQNATSFLTNAFIPVTTLSSDPGGGADVALQNQWDVQQNAIDGAVYNIKISNGGAGYSSAPTVVISGDGSGLTATATQSGGVVTGITVTAPGSGYTRVAISFTGGGSPTTDAEAYAVLGPPGGFGADPVKTFRGHFVALNVSLIYDDGAGDFPINQDFRQLGIIRNPYDYGTTNVASASTLSATYSLDVALGYAFTPDMIIEETVTGAKGLVVNYDSINGIIRFIQTPETGYKQWTTNAVSEEGDSGNAVNITALNNPEVEPRSGDVIFQENRTAINRAGDQIETIKLVLEF